MKHRRQQKVRREWRALPYTRTVGEKRQENVFWFRDTHVVLGLAPGRCDATPPCGAIVCSVAISGDNLTVLLLLI